MKLAFKPFDNFVRDHTTASTRSRHKDSSIMSLDLGTNRIYATVLGTMIYEVFVKFNNQEVINAQCTCPYDQTGYCKHIVHVLREADKLKTLEETPAVNPNNDFKLPLVRNGEKYIIKEKNILDLTEEEIDYNTKIDRSFPPSPPLSIANGEVRPNQLKLAIVEEYFYSLKTNITQNGKDIEMTCQCHDSTDKICPHLGFVLKDIIRDDSNTQLAFDQELRHYLLKLHAEDLELQGIKDLDKFFDLKLKQDSIICAPKQNILTFDDGRMEYLRQTVLPTFKLPAGNKQTRKIDFLMLEITTWRVSYQLMTAPLAKNGNIKSPIKRLPFMDEKRPPSDNPESLNFFMALAESDNEFDTPSPALQNNIIKNPLNYPVYYFTGYSDEEKVTPKKLKPIQLLSGHIHPIVSVRQKGNLFQINLLFDIDGKKVSSKTGKLEGHFFCIKDQFHFLKNEVVYKLLSFFKQNSHEFYLTEKVFKDFKAKFLDPLEQSVTVTYDFIKKAPKKLIKKEALDEITNHNIYLSEDSDYILIKPVIKYGVIETSVLSPQNIYTENKKGKMFLITRNEDAELRFKKAVQEQHPDFEEAPEMPFYHLHKNEFLEDGWFLDAFEAWREKGYNILGFKELKNNNLNTHKMSVKSSISSGIDWFDVQMDVSFGDQEISLKEIRKSVVNKKRFVPLGDGTKGLLPQEWIDKFSRYFRSGEIKEDAIRTHKSHFAFIDEMFEEEVLPHDVSSELEAYREKMANFHSIRNVEVSKKLKGTLRDYQKEGLNWLNFLDEFEFGGCLADDMGLGKTIQLISYFLQQIESGHKEPNLVVVPTSLLYNWETEIKKFAPKLKYKIVYGAKRKTDKIKFEKYNVAITTYGTMLNDIEILKVQAFNVIALDESQAIKNPNSKRYKAARLLQARQRIVLTGTPVENNTFDLYAQLSFAVPGLLGSAGQFTEDYAKPIDKYQDKKRAEELQKKVQPFILRRTKNQVATELPEKTEMVIYCEMDKSQRRVYEAYKKEFQKFLTNNDAQDLKSKSMHILQGLTKMRQICNTPALLNDEEYYGNSSAKIDELMMQIQKLRGNHKILIFSQFVSMLDLIRERLDKEAVNYAYLTGKTRKRQEQVDLFQEDEETRIFLISIKAGGTGLNLTKAEYVFIVDPWWNPAVENQAIDRAHRIGQENKVMAIRLITPDSIEEKIMKLQQQKKKLVEDLIHTDSGFFKSLTKEDLMEIV